MPHIIENENSFNYRELSSREADTGKSAKELRAHL